MTVRRAAGLAGLLVAAVGLGGCGGPRAASGDEVVAGVADAVDGEPRTAVLPTGTLAVTVGAPVDEVTGEESRDAEAVRAPDGSSLVPVHWEFDASGAPLGGRLSDDPQEAEVSLSVGDETRAVGSPYAVRGTALATDPRTTFYVVVPGEPAADDVSVSVTYDGAEQVLAGDGTVSGVAAGLGDLADAEVATVPCPADAWTGAGDTEVDVVCEDLQTFATPYWPGRGWAAGETQWRVVAAARVGAARFAGAGASYDVTDVQATLGGEPLTGTTYGHSVDGTVVLDDASDAVLELTLAGALSRGDGPTEREVTLRQRLTLP